MTPKSCLMTLTLWHMYTHTLSSTYLSTDMCIYMTYIIYDIYYRYEILFQISGMTACPYHPSSGEVLAGEALGLAAQPIWPIGELLVQ